MKTENYVDMMARLFPDTKASLVVGGRFTRDITIQVTEKCNLRCTYCYQHDKTPKMLPVETGKRFIDLILASDERTAAYIQSRDCPAVMLNFIGGEPFLAIDTIAELTDYFILRMIELNHPWLTRYRIGISSNGLLYFDEKVQKYLRKHGAHVSLTITIDGNKQLHDMCRIDATGKGSYDRAHAAAVDWAKRCGQIPGTKITIAPGNIVYLGDALCEFIDEGYQRIHANCVYEEGWTTVHARWLYYELKKTADHLLETDKQDSVCVSILDDMCGVPYPTTTPWCGGNGLMMALDVNGDIYPCIRYTPSSVGQDHEKYKLGDVEHGLAGTPEELERIRCLACINRQSQCNAKCKTCPIAAGCGDCAGYSYEVFGEIGHRTTYICEMHIARALAQVYYKNKAHQKTGIKEPLGLNTPRDWAVPIIGPIEYEYLRTLVNEGGESSNGGQRNDH